jgi:two-component system sensor histidine kinase MprB
MSFRTRLALASSAAVAVAVILASGGAYLLVRDSLRGEVDDALHERADLPELLPRIVRPRPLPPAPFGGASGFFQIVSADGEVARPTGSPALPAGSRERRVASGEEDEFLTDAKVAGVHLRVLTTPLPGGLAFQIARPLDEVDSVLSRLRLLLVLVSLAGIALATALGLVVTRTATAPVRRLIGTAEQIAATGDPTRRVETAGSDELARLGEAFNQMLAALERSLGAQRQLVADASHELRTPLTSLRTNVELLASGRLAKAERTAALEAAGVQVEELSALVSDLVELGRDGEQPPELEDVRLDLLVVDAVERAQRHAPGVRFELDAQEVTVRGAPDRLHRAVSNLLDNAARWSPPGEPVEVGVRDGEITVRDHGPGIAEGERSRVFDRFYRAPDARGTPGSGLGLAIVRRVAEIHHGSATAEEAPGGGALLRLRLSSNS